ncbi:exonuclease domain-containing protein [Megasphaera elsdenii]|uniref:exonuclease domain-containing protein n=1 Tax=Megasphaera elsdenii TaxID=907 RepID=UPI00242E8408|nr:exonuclease domain-containing protein [Megasphaera elsdenii]
MFNIFKKKDKVVISLTSSPKEPKESEKLEKSKKYIRHKGISLLSLPDNYIVLDLETTGYNPHFDEIIEVACIRYSGSEKIDSFHSYVQPTPYGDDSIHYVDDFITKLTGITDDMLVTAPKFKDIANELYDYLGDSVIVGHNVNFDINFLYDNFLKCLGCEFKNDYLDTMRLSRIALPDLPHHRLKDLKEYFSIDGVQHRALNDCQITHTVLSKLLDYIQENNVDLERYLHPKRFDLTSLTGDVTLNDPSNPLYGKHCVFTGKLQRFVRKDAAQIVCNIGGCCDNSVTKKTNFLIIGGLDDIPLVKDGKSTKMKKAEKLILDGQDLKILSESTFYDLIEDSIK